MKGTHRDYPSTGWAVLYTDLDAIGKIFNKPDWPRAAAKKAPNRVVVRITIEEEEEQNGSL